MPLHAWPTLPPQRQFDKQFDTTGTDFVLFDYKKPERIPRERHHQYDLVVIDPPHVTEDVWDKYAEATRLLARSTGGGGGRGFGKGAWGSF